jgi:hypothetical protein
MCSEQQTKDDSYDHHEDKCDSFHDYLISLCEPKGPDGAGAHASPPHPVWPQTRSRLSIHVHGCLEAGHIVLRDTVWIV